MGNFLRLFFREDSSEPHTQTEFFLHFLKSASPRSIVDLEVQQEGQRLIAESFVLIEALTLYGGASQEIQRALLDPCPENELSLSKALKTLFSTIFSFYSFSLKLGDFIPRLLQLLVLLLEDTQRTFYDSEIGLENPPEFLESQQSLFLTFAQLMEFMIGFDELKAKRPFLANDFSFYKRRVVSRRGSNESNESNGSNEIENENVSDFGAITLFLGSSTPMLSSVSSSLISSFSTSFSVSSCTGILSLLAHACSYLLSHPYPINNNNNIQDSLSSCLPPRKSLILSLLISILLLIDHVTPRGLFCKKESMDETKDLNVDQFLKLLRRQKKEDVESLMNVLKYSLRTLHLDSTPLSSKTLLFHQ